jgi:ketosteroid isomerase-like protein
MSLAIDNTRKAYKAFSEGDLATVTSLIAPDCIWHVGGRSALTGDYIGHDQILGYFGKLLELTGGTFSVRLEDIAELPATGQVVCVVTTRGTRNGTTMEMKMVELCRVDADGLLKESWWYPEDVYAGDAFFGPAEIVLPAQGRKTTAPV